MFYFPNLFRYLFYATILLLVFVGWKYSAELKPYIIYAYDQAYAVCITMYKYFAHSPGVSSRP
ncbi:MAG: hypothetical protein HQM10_04770 [Candidatus Riflebacteria bacterium]|nr:hypothetical protein [Candidatus Riflebacteria bacterium]